MSKEPGSCSHCSLHSTSSLNIIDESFKDETTNECLGHCRHLADNADFSTVDSSSVCSNALMKSIIPKKTKGISITKSYQRSLFTDRCPQKQVGEKSQRTEESLEINATFSEHYTVQV